MDAGNSVINVTDTDNTAENSALNFDESETSNCCEKAWFIAT